MFRADTEKLDSYINNCLQKWGGVNPDILPESIKHLYNFEENSLKLQELTLEEKMFVWDVIAPKNKCFLVFTDGTDFNYANHSQEDVNNFVIGSKPIAKYLQRQAITNESEIFSTLTKFNGGIKKPFTFNKNKGTIFLEEIKKFIFSYENRITKICQSNGITSREFTILVGASYIENFDALKAKKIYARYTNSNAKTFRLNKYGKKLINMNLLESTRFGKTAIYNTTLKGEELITKILKNICEF